MFCNPNGAEQKRQRNRTEKSGLFTQLNLMSQIQQGYSSILIMYWDRVLLYSGGISE